jgi:hypothetical protein
VIWIDDFPIDIATSESYSFESEATKFPVEEGADVSDHVRIQGLVITIECIVSNTPIGRIASDPSRLPIEFDRDLAIPDPKTRVPANDALEKLIAIRDARKPVTYEGSKGVFENMVLSFTVPVDIASIGGLRFNAKLEQIQISENRLVTVRKAAVPRGQSKVNRGAVAALNKIGGQKSVLVFTVRHGRKPPSWLVGRKPEDVGTLIFTSTTGRHYRAEQGALSDGYVDAAGYHPFKEPLPTPIYVDAKDAVVDNNGNVIPQTTDYVSPLEKRIGPDPIPAWRDMWSDD